MGSTNHVNFSVRQNKAIERSLVLQAASRLIEGRDPKSYLYVGFGSVWFVDFDAAHRGLGIQDMISIEADPVVYKRAVFNKPYRTIEVVSGLSHDVIPAIVGERPELLARPWFLWLDYDQALDETKLDELAQLVRMLPDESIIATTFSASPGRYGIPNDRLSRFSDLLGDSFPSERFKTPRDLKDETLLMRALADAVNTYLLTTHVQIGRQGFFEPALCIQYQDGTPMVTAGGLLCGSADRRVQVRAMTSDPSWPGRSDTPVIVPPLTHREVAGLRSLLPCDPMPTREDVRRLGFDLEDTQLKSFVAHYLNYPSFVQMVR